MRGTHAHPPHNKNTRTQTSVLTHPNGVVGGHQMAPLPPKSLSLDVMCEGGSGGSTNKKKWKAPARSRGAWAGGRRWRGRDGTRSSLSVGSLCE